MGFEEWLLWAELFILFLQKTTSTKYGESFWAFCESLNIPYFGNTYQRDFIHSLLWVITYAFSISVLPCTTTRLCYCYWFGCYIMVTVHLYSLPIWKYYHKFQLFFCSLFFCQSGAVWFFIFLAILHLTKS